ncbi:nucleoporin Nup186/Nup192/Nup205 [Geopyxis carbonaria]|nr:nucleoporin Nup186/Nup192/Nup205 [Geopyxis carbonaria]
MDEILAAKLLLRGTEAAESIDRTPIQSAKFLYHGRRKNLLDAIRLMFSYVVDENVGNAARVVLADATENLVASGGTHTFSERCISAMAAVRSAVQQLREKCRHAQTLGMAPDPGFIEDLELQLRFLRNQHEMLASIVFYLVKSKRTVLADFKRLLQVVKGLDRYDVFMAHHMLPLFAFIGTLCGIESPLSFGETIGLHKEMLKDYRESAWTLRPVQAAVMVWWLSEFNGICRDPPSSNTASVTQLDYGLDVYNPMKTALKDGGLESIMAISADISAEYPLNSAKEDLHRFLQTRVPPLEDVSVLLPPFKTLLISQLEIFIDSFISNMADLLKEIKTREEEDVLLTRRNGTFDHELERFFLTIYYVYQGRRDAGITFWNDPESNLHGFLTWASTRQTPFMAATFSYMLAAIANGNECADAAHKFLLDEMIPGSTKNRRTFYISWDHIFGRFQKYIQQLEKSANALAPNAAYKPPPPPTETEELEELSMTLDGFMRLASQISVNSPAGRNWLIAGTASFNLINALFELLRRQRDTLQLWDTIFSTLTALLTDKSVALSHYVWSKLDSWALGLPSVNTGALPVGGSSAVVKNGFGRGASENFDLIVSTVHPAEAFSNLIAKLVEPSVEVAGLKDALPFPENLGSSNRTSGMEPYTDFILGTIFSNSTIANLPQELAINPEKQETPSERVVRNHYRKLRPALQLGCLRFIHACLQSFNDDLISIAHKNLPVDGGIRCSSLLAYATLHPFARVMEHILTEKCLNVLFEILHLGVESLQSYIEPPTPVVEAVWFTILILDLALQMQPTYFRVIRPKIQEEDKRRINVAGNPFDRLEKAVHYHLQTIVHLGLYVGASQLDVALAAIKLLEKFNMSPHLVASTESNIGQHPPKNRILGTVEQSPDSRRIVFNFINQWQRDAELSGPENWFPLKMPILKFLESTLEAQPNEYTLAHMILGFGYDPKDGISMSIASGGIGSGVSLLHSILNDAQETTENNDLNYSRPHCELKNSCYSILAQLWKSPSTSSEILYMLRANKFLMTGFVSEIPISQSTLWNDVPFEISVPFFREGAYSYCSFLKRRTALFDYTALEIRQLTVQGASTSVQNHLSTLMGVSLTPEGPIDSPHILDLLDFLEFSLPETLSPPQPVWFNDFDFSVFQEENKEGIALFDIDRLEQFLEIRINELAKNGVDSEQMPALENEMLSVLQHLFSENQLQLCRNARLGCLKAWVTLVMVTLEDCEMDMVSKTAFVLQTLQAILPKLEVYCTDDIESAQELSALAHSLSSHLSFNTATFGAGRGSDLANDRLYQLFRISLRCIQSPSATAKIREDFYNIALRYLNGMASISTQDKSSRLHSTHTIKASGDRLLEVLCNDAYAGDGLCKVVSLQLLESLAALAVEDGSTYVVDALARQNFLVVLIESIKSIGWDLKNTSTDDIPMVMKAFKAATAFLLRIAQTRPGAGQVINAGFFQALRECELFSVDPDLGVGFQNPRALLQYHELLLDIMRVVATCIVSRGPQNRQALDAAKLFLLENRNTAVTIFKRHAGIGGKGMENSENLKDLADVFVLLFALTGFVEV